jgi:hypothetical protein
MVITWLNRGTLHLVAAEDFWWLHPLTTPQLAATSRRRLRQEGVSEVDARRGVDVVIEAVHEHGPQTRLELRDRLDAARVPTAGQALVHVLLAASLRDEIVRGPMRGAEHAFVAVSDWLGAPPEPLARADGLARLARRYLEGHGPAEPRDLAKWAGITLGDARIAFDGARGPRRARRRLRGRNVDAERDDTVCEASGDVAPVDCERAARRRRRARRDAVPWIARRSRGRLRTVTRALVGVGRIG